MAGGETTLANEEKIITTTVRMPESINLDISNIAELEHRSMNSMIVKILSDFVKQNKEVI